MTLRQGYIWPAGALLWALAGGCWAASSGQVTITGSVPAACDVTVSATAGASIANLTLGNPDLRRGSGEYNVFDATPYAQTVTFTVNALVNLGTCNYFVALRAGQSSDGNNRYLNLGGTHLPYTVYTDATLANILLPESGAATANQIAGSFSTVFGLNQTQNQSFVWRIPPQHIVAASATRYTDPGVVLELWEDLAGLGIPLMEDTFSLTFQAKAETSVDIAVVANGDNFNLGSTTRTVAFGNVSSGAVQRFDLSVRSNSGYSVTLQSQNSQVLAPTAVGVSGSIPYSLTVNGGSVNLAGGAPVQVASQNGGTTPLLGTALPVQVTLGTLTGTETAGDYQDVLSVAVSAN